MESLKRIGYSNAKVHYLKYEMEDEKEKNLTLDGYPEMGVI